MLSEISGPTGSVKLGDLEPGEVPIIAQKGEEVLTRMEPRHRDCLGNGSKGETRTFQPIVLFDKDELTRIMLSSSEGVEAMVTVVGENPDKFNRE